MCIRDRVRTEWPYEFTREAAAYPVDSLVHRKYFPPVRRIDEAYGDRNLVCACPPPEAFDLSADTEDGEIIEPTVTEENSK